MWKAGSAGEAWWPGLESAENYVGKRTPGGFLPAQVLLFLMTNHSLEATPAGPVPGVDSQAGLGEEGWGRRQRCLAETTQLLSALAKVTSPGHPAYAGGP